MSILSLTKSELENNHLYWENELQRKFPSGIENAKDVNTFLFEIPTTHTWGYASVQSDNSHPAFLYEKILFEDESLLSKQERKRREMRKPREDDEVVGIRTIGPKAEDAGLDEYVFAYLGVHDPYYSRSDFPAFGVFMGRRQGFEEFPNCNVSRRDLDSVELNNPETELEKNFLLPEAGRHLANIECQIDPRHQNDPWRYWGANPHYSRNCWEWKYEFHYKGVVNVHDFCAILWPVEVAYLSNSKGIKLETKLNKDSLRFKDKFPNCKVIQYAYDGDDPEMDLIYASTYAAKYYIERGYFPAQIEKYDGGE